MFAPGLRRARTDYAEIPMDLGAQRSDAVPARYYALCAPYGANVDSDLNRAISFGSKSDRDEYVVRTGENCTAVDYDDLSSFERMHIIRHESLPPMDQVWFLRRIAGEDD